MKPRFEVFSQGEEIITGQTVDSNAAWLSQQAVRQGFVVARHTAVGDKLEDLVGLLQEIAVRADCCVCTGGLGPTSDDLTAEAVANAFHKPLEFDTVAFDHIQRFFANRNRPMPEANRKQAMLPKGAERLDNAWGTAPGFTLFHGRCWFVFLPGVPSEMKPMFLEYVLPRWSGRFQLRPSDLITLRTVGIGESDIQQRLNELTLPEPVQLGFRASLHEVQTKLLFPHGYDVSAMAALTERVAELLGDAVFAVDRPDTDNGDLAAVVDKLMSAQGKTLAVVETISQGLLAGLCVGSEWLLESRFEQSRGRLAASLGVQFDAERPLATAEAMALAVRQQSGADFALVQLYAGDRELLRERDQGVGVYTVLLSKGDCRQAIHTVAGSGKRKQHQAACLGLDVLRRHLQGRL